MYQALKNFPKQFEYEPVIENEHRFRRANKFVVVGMGGSHLATDIIKEWDPDREIIIHRSYFLPLILKKTLEQSLIILSSYSGNTEEVISAYQQALEQNYKTVVIAVGGRLISLAKAKGLPYIQMPNTGIQPRAALGFSTKAHLKAMGVSKGLKELTALSLTLNGDVCQKQGQDLAKNLVGKIPIIYSSARNFAIVYNWKIKFNETGKIPAFYNLFPELNHNEITGFDPSVKTKNLTEKFFFIFLRDKTDYSRIQKGMELTKKLYQKRGFPVAVFDLEGKSIWHKIFSSLLLADWTAYYTAINYGVEPEEVPLQEEFKKTMRKEVKAAQI